MAKSNRQLLITLGADTTTFSQKVKRAKDLTKELDSNFKLLSSSSKDFENSIDGLAKKHDYLNDRIKIATTLNDAYIERLADQKDRLDKSTKSMQKLEKELKELKEVQEDSLDTAEWDAWQKEIDAVEDELAQVKKETKSFQDSIIGLNTAMNKNQTEIQKMNAELAETKLQFDFLSRDKTFDEMREDISETEREFTNIKNSTDGFGRAISDLKAEKAQLNIQMEKTNNLMDEYSVDIEKSTVAMKQMENKIESLTTELRDMENVLEHMDENEQHYRDWSNQVNNLRAELTSANRILEIHKNRVDTLTNSYKQSENSLKSMEGSVKRVDNEIYNFGKKNNFKEINNHLENLQHEFDLFGSKMELLKSKFMNFENSIIGAIGETKLLKEQMKNLTQQFDAQQNAMNEYKLKMQELITKKQNLKQEIDKLSASLEGIDKNSPTFVRTSTAMGELERNLESVENELDDVNNKLKQMEIESNNTLTSINTNIQGQTRVWDTLGNKIKSAGSTLQSLGGNLQSVGGAMMPLTASFTALSAGIIKTGTDFQAQITRLGALTGENGDALKKVMAELEEGARQLGSTTQYSATQAAQGLEDFMLAGYSATDAIKAMPIAVQMATADNIELSESTELLTTALSSLGDNSELTGNQIEDLGIIANQMAVNAVATTTDMAGLARSLVKVGGQAENMKIPLSTTNTLLGILGDKGVVAEEAGNALSSILINLTQSTGQSADAMKELGLSAFDADGNIKPIEKTLGELKKKLEGFDGDKQEIILKNMLGGKTQAKTLMKLLQGIDSETGNFTEKYKNLKKELEDAPNIDALGQMYKKSTDTLKYEFQTLKSVAEESFLTMFDGIEPQLRGIVTSVTDVIKQLTKSDVITNALSSVLEVIQTLIDMFANLSPKMQENIIKFMAWGAILAPIIMVVGSLVTGIGSILTVFGSLVGGTGKVIGGFKLLKENGVTLKGFFTDFKGTVGKVASTLSGKLTGATTGVAGKFSKLLAPAISGLSKLTIPGLILAVSQVITSLGNNEDAITSLIDKWGWFGTMLSGIMEFMAGICQITIGNIILMVKMLGKALVTLLKGDFKNLDDVFREGWAEIENNSRVATSNIQMESTRAISKIRDLTRRDLDDVKHVFETTFAELPKTTSKNLGEVSENLAKSFADTKGEVISLSDSAITTLRGTSDTMASLFNRITRGMDISDAKTIFESNLKQLLNSGATTTEELTKEFEKAGQLIEKNLVDGIARTTQNADEVLKEFNSVVSGNLDEGLNDIVSIIGELDANGLKSLRQLGTNWNAIFGNVKADGSQSVQEMKDAMLANLERLGLDTPEKLQAFKNTLQTELDMAQTQVREDGQILGLELLEGVEQGTIEGSESTGQTIKDTTKNVTQKATEGAKEGFETLPESVRQELEKAGVSINEQGNVIVADMGKKGKEGASAYVKEMNAQLPQLSGVAGTIQNQLKSIDSVRFGGVTKQLSEINRWLGVVNKTSATTKTGLSNITTVSFGATTKGLSEINKWLKDNVTKNAKDTKSSLKDITTVTFGATTKGLSEVNKWLKDNVSKSAKSAKTDLQNLANVRFGGLTSSLSSVVNMLNNITNKANSTRTAINRVINANTRSMLSEPTQIEQVHYAVPAFDAYVTPNADINRFKTTGGFYNPTPIGTTNNNSDSSSIKNTDALLKATLEQNQLLLQLLNQQKPVEVAVNMDGRQVAKASAKYMESEINLLNARKSRLGGK